MFKDLGMTCGVAELDCKTLIDISADQDFTFLCFSLLDSHPTLFGPWCTLGVVLKFLPATFSNSYWQNHLIWKYSREFIIVYAIASVASANIDDNSTLIFLILKVWIIEPDKCCWGNLECTINTNKSWHIPDWHNSQVIYYLHLYFSSFLWINHSVRKWSFGYFLWGVNNLI